MFDWWALEVTVSLWLVFVVLGALVSLCALAIRLDRGLMCAQLVLLAILDQPIVVSGQRFYVVSEADYLARATENGGSND